MLGIDGNLQNTKEAERRNQKLSKKWKALVTKEARKKNIVEIGDVTPQSDLYKTTSKMVFANTDLKSLAIETFADIETDDICLVGLHTCGNLAANSLKQFVNYDHVKLVCNVGCCYHLLYEEFETDFFNDEMRKMDERDEPGFPMSKFLRDKGYKLGRNARMLGSQCYERVIANKSLPDESLFHRALFEKLLREKWRRSDTPAIHRLGKIRFKTIEDYLRKGCAKFGIDIDLSSEDIQKLFDDHEYERHQINLTYFIRLLLAKTIETLILLDRYLFLLESGVDNVFLVKIFDPVISPRNYALIAIKK